VLDKEAILASLAVQPGQTVLDAGCGNGYMSKELSRLVGPGGKVYALDPDEPSIATLRQETEGTNIAAVVGDITIPTALPAAAFDLVYLCTVVHGFSPEQMPAFVAEVKRLLAPGGRLAIVEIAKRPTPFGPPMHLRFSPDELQEAVDLPALDTVELGEHFYLQVFGGQPKA